LTDIEARVVGYQSTRRDRSPSPIRLIRDAKVVQQQIVSTVRIETAEMDFAGAGLVDDNADIGLVVLPGGFSLNGGSSASGDPNR